MKIKMEIEVEATPKEVRDTMGLPDVQAVQERIIAKIEKKAMDVLSDYDPTKILSIFLPEGFRLTESMQKMVMDSIPKILKTPAKKVDKS